MAMVLERRNRYRAKIRIETQNSNGMEFLSAVTIESTHEHFGHGKIRLNRDQLRHLAARLTQLDVAFGEHASPDTQVVTTMLPRCGAEAYPVTLVENDSVRLVGIKLQVEGNGAVYLMPEQLSAVRQDLSRISREYLGYHGWGGEDARDQ